MVDKFGSILKVGDFFLYVDEYGKIEKDIIKQIVYQPMVGEYVIGKYSQEGQYYRDYEIVKNK